jgi:hypothetical protein
VVVAGLKRVTRSGPTITTTLAPVVLVTGAADAAGSMLVAGRLRATATAWTSAVAPPTVKISEAVTFRSAFVAVRVANPLEARKLVTAPATPLVLVALATRTWMVEGSTVVEVVVEVDE